ncbi:MAG TPA: enoyl-CoA hydratase-related protein [Puia sp.]|nr:enoyl-CoA hydratase-related protein [Puia sp.]
MSSIHLAIDDGIGAITLNRPEKFNSFNREMALLLQKTLDDCSSDERVRCILLTGTGKAFCAGQDLTELSCENPPGFDKILSEHYNPIVKRIRNIQKPIVCAINGVAAGAGANIALCCDVVVAAVSASFIQAFSRIGLIPDSGGTFILPRLIGFQRSSAIMMLGDKIASSDAEKMGMVYKVFPDDSLIDESRRIARRLAQLPTKALAFTKQALNASLSNSLEQQLETEDKLQFAAAQTADYAEGVKAFLEKRAPKFTGN